MKAHMTETLTIRLPGPIVRHLRAPAGALGISPSQLVRATLEKEIGVRWRA